MGKSISYEKLPRQDRRIRRRVGKKDAGKKAKKVQSNVNTYAGAYIQL